MVVGWRWTVYPPKFLIILILVVVGDLKMPPRKHVQEQMASRDAIRQPPVQGWEIGVQLSRIAKASHRTTLTWALSTYLNMGGSFEGI